MWKLRWDIGINATGQFFLGHPVPFACGKFLLLMHSFGNVESYYWNKNASFGVVATDLFNLK